MNRPADFFDHPGVVAVTGHCLNRMTPPVAARLLEICQTTFREADPDCILLSCLADGTDLIAAMAWPESRRLHSLLPVPLPRWRAILGDLVDPGMLDGVLARTVPEIIGPG